jgi:hypothetical protein
VQLDRGASGDGGPLLKEEKKMGERKIQALPVLGAKRYR